jgi:hypothetical protein
VPKKIETARVIKEYSTEWTVCKGNANTHLGKVNAIIVYLLQDQGDNAIFSCEEHV